MDFDQTITMPANAVVDIPFEITTPEIETKSEEIFEGNNTSRDLVEEIVLKSLILELATPSDGDFGFMKSITILMAADGLPEIEIASAPIISSEIGEILTLDASNEDLKEYLKKVNFSLTLRIELDEPTDTDHVINLASIFTVDAKVLGQ